MNVSVPIYIHSTHVDIRADKDGYIGVMNGHIKYAIKQFSIDKFDVNTNKYIGSVRYHYYDGNEQIYRFPKYALKYIETCFTKMKEFGIPVELEKVYIDPVETIDVDYRMQYWIKDRPGQKEAIEYLSSNKDMLACEAGTGFGKTTVSIKTAILKRVPFLVVCDGLMDQWKKNILEKTNIPENKIFIIQGSNSLLKLFKRIENNDKPIAIIGSIQTLRNYIKRETYPYTELPLWEELLKILNIGIIIKDEYHLNFNAYLLVDLFSNVKTNIYLSATPRRNDYQEAVMFNKIYPASILGDRTNSKKHVEINLCGYKMFMDVNDSKFKTKYGYSQNIYESFILKRPGKLTEYLQIIQNVADSEYFNKYYPKEVKCVIFCYTKKMCKEVSNYLRSKHANYSIKTKLSEDPEENLNADVIVSTIGSLGTGHDLSKLVTIINTVSTKAQTKLEQVPGRLRPVEGYQCKYIDLYNDTLKFHRSHLYVKRRIYKILADKYKEFNI